MESSVLEVAAASEWRWRTRTPTVESWQALSAAIELEPGIRNWPWETLRGRWEAGQAAVAVEGARIISYTSVVPLWRHDDVMRLPPHKREWLGCHADVRLYGSQTGWTAPAWRGRGVSTALRGPLYGSLHAPRDLLLSTTDGKGAGSLLRRFGWRPLAWTTHPYIGSVAGVPRGSLLPPGLSSWPVPDRFDVYDGPPELPRDHPWDRYCHLWVSDLATAQSLDRRIDESCAGDLAAWRASVLEVLASAARAGLPWPVYVFPRGGLSGRHDAARGG